MTQTKLNIETPDGVADALAFRPDSGPHVGAHVGTGPWPGIVLYFDAFGSRPAMHRMAQRLASTGYYVLLPNLFYRAGAIEPFDAKTAFADPAQRARLMALMGALDTPAIAKDAKAYLDALAAQPDVAGDRFGAVGYCMGGRLAFMTAGLLGSRVAAAASIHGGGLVTDKPDSPHLRAAEIAARLYFGVADHDKSCTPEAQATLRRALDAAHVAYEMEVYPGARHGFAVPDHEVYDEAAAEKSWGRVGTLFDEALRKR